MAITNYLPSSRLIQPGVCTSTTRPASPFEGMVIYETDTNNTLTYNGSAWVCITPQSSLDETTRSTASATFTSLTGSPSVAIATGTKALITISAMYVSTATGYVHAGCAVSGATTIAASITKAASTYWGTNDIGNDKTTSFTYLETGLTAGNNTFTFQIQSNSGTTTIKQKSITVVGIP